MSINLSDKELSVEELNLKLEGFERDYEINKVLQKMNRSAINNYKRLIKAIHNL